MVLCKSKRSSTRTLEHITSFIENKLFLNVNRDKTVVSHVSKIKFLVYGFYLRDGCHLRPHVKSIIKMKDRIKSLTSRSNGLGDLVRKEQLRYFITGWVNYFSLARMSKLMQRIDEWYRRRVRMVIWKRWKKVKTRLRNLMKLGLSKQKAWEYSNTRKGYWHIANSWILSTTITNARLKQSGYLFFSDYYVKVRNVN